MSLTELCAYFLCTTWRVKAYHNEGKIRSLLQIITAYFVPWRTQAAMMDWCSSVTTGVLTKSTKRRRALYNLPTLRALLMKMGFKEVSLSKNRIVFITLSNGLMDGFLWSECL